MVATNFQSTQLQIWLGDCRVAYPVQLRAGATSHQCGGTLIASFSSRLATRRPVSLPVLSLIRMKKCPYGHAAGSPRVSQPFLELL